MTVGMLSVMWSWPYGMSLTIILLTLFFAQNVFLMIHL